MQTLPLLGSLLGGAAVLTWRLRETTRPVTAGKILIPPLAMSTGFCMFLAPATRIPFTWGILAFAAGALLLSYPLILTSELTRVGEVIMLRRSRAFLWILLGLFAVRLAARSYVEDQISTLQTGAIFFILAFGMIVPWRLAMYRKYRALVAARAIDPSR